MKFHKFLHGRNSRRFGFRRAHAAYGTAKQNIRELPQNIRELPQKMKTAVGTAAATAKNAVKTAKQKMSAAVGTMRNKFTRKNATKAIGGGKKEEDEEAALIAASTAAGAAGAAGAAAIMGLMDADNDETCALLGLDDGFNGLLDALKTYREVSGTAIV